MARGQVQSLMSGAASSASSVLHFCQELEEFWAYQVLQHQMFKTKMKSQDLLEPFAARLSSCCSPELLPLLDIAGQDDFKIEVLVFINVLMLCRSQVWPSEATARRRVQGCIQHRFRGPRHLGQEHPASLP